MKRVTITLALEEDVVRWVSIRAADRGISVARLVGEMLREQMLEEESYEEARQDYLSRDPVALNRSEGYYPKRDEIHHRADTR